MISDDVRVEMCPVRRNAVCDALVMQCLQREVQ